MPTRNHNLMAQRGSLLQALESILDTAEEAGRDLTAEERGRYDAIAAQVDELAKSELGGDPTPGGRMRGGNGDRDEAFDTYLRTGNVPEQRALAAGTGSAGGYLVPAGFRTALTERLKFYVAVRAVAEIVQTDSGNALPWPTNDDTGNVGELLAENTQSAEQDLVVGQKQLGAYKYNSKFVRVSVELLDDSAFDVETWLVRKLAERIGRIQNTAFTTGTGTSQPQGVVTGATTGVTAAATGTFTTDELIDLIHSVDPAYREPANECAFMMSDTALAQARKLKDSQGHYLIEPDARAGLPNTIFGYRVLVNPAMSAPATGVKSVLFGNLRAGYVIRDVKEVRVMRLVERWADYYQEGFGGFLRSDGLVQDSYAYRALTQA